MNAAYDKLLSDNDRAIYVGIDIWSSPNPTSNSDQDQFRSSNN